MDAVMRGVEERAEGAGEYYDSYFAYTGLDHAKPNDEEMRLFVLEMFAKYPPQPFVLPDGAVTMNSPWLLALEMPNVVNGREWLKRIEKAFGRE